MRYGNAMAALVEIDKLISELKLSIDMHHPNSAWPSEPLNLAKALELNTRSLLQYLAKHS